MEGAWQVAGSSARSSGRRDSALFPPQGRPCPRRAVTHLPGPFPERCPCHGGLLRGPSPRTPARSWPPQPSRSEAHLPLGFVLSCWESRETVSEGDVITPESSVVSSDAKQLPTDTVSSASRASSVPPGPRGGLAGRDTAGTGQTLPRPAQRPRAHHRSAQPRGDLQLGVLGIKTFRHDRLLQKRFTFGGGGTQA